jgi:hypothetical protein
VEIPWVELFAVFVVCHVAGDFILQTEFQASHKHGGLGRDPVRRRALAMHTLSYTACYLPALIWLAGDVADWVLPVVALAVALPHGIQDDGRPIRWWLRHVKRTQTGPGYLSVFVDQSFHLVTLLLLALAVGV